MPVSVRFGSPAPYGALSFAVIGGYDAANVDLDTVYAFEAANGGGADSWKLLPQRLLRPKHAALAIPVRSVDFPACV